MVRKKGGKERVLANLQEGRLSHEMLAKLQPLCACVCVEWRVCDRIAAPPALSAVESFNESGPASTKGCRTKGL